MLTVLENHIKYVKGLFYTMEEAIEYLSIYPDQELTPRELPFDKLPFFAIYEIDVNSDGHCYPLYVKSKDEVIDYMKSVDLEKFTKHYDDPDDDQIFILNYYPNIFKPNENYFTNHSHIRKNDVRICKRYIEQERIARAKRLIFNFNRDFADAELGIFWTDLDLEDVYYSVTVYTSDVEKTNPKQYDFSYAKEWENQKKDILYDDDWTVQGNSDDYPHGRIFFADNMYYVELTSPITYRLMRSIRQRFRLPIETRFICTPKEKP